MSTIGDMKTPQTARVVLEPGEYKIRCNDVEVKPSSKGNLQIKWSCVEVETGGELTFWSSLHENAKDITFNWLLAFGCQETDPQPETEMGWNVYLRKTCRGKVALAQLAIETKCGKCKAIIEQLPCKCGNEEGGKVYRNNIVSPPWEIYPANNVETKEDLPDFLK